MKPWIRNTGLGAVALTSVATYELATEHEVKTVEGANVFAYMRGSPTSGHDQYAANIVDSTVTMSQYCWNGAVLLRDKNYGDVVFSPYAYSTECQFNNASLPTIPFTGGQNVDEDICDPDRDYSMQIVISNGNGYGPCVDYFITDENGRYVKLSFALPRIADYAVQINEARINAGLSPVHTRKMREYLSDSSDVDEIREGRWYGEHIDLQAAIELSTVPTSTPILTGVYYLILE